VSVCLDPVGGGGEGEEDIFDTKVSYYAYSFFLSFFLFLPTHCRYRELLLHLITVSVLHACGWTPTDEGSARHGDLYFTTHITHKRQTSMPWRD